MLPWHEFAGLLPAGPQQRAGPQRHTSTARTMALDRLKSGSTLRYNCRLILTAYFKPVLEGFS